MINTKRAFKATFYREKRKMRKGVRKSKSTLTATCCKKKERSP